MLIGLELLYTVGSIYRPLGSDLELAGFGVSSVTIEVDCLGHIIPSCVSNLCNCRKTEFKMFLDRLRFLDF